MDTGKRKLVRWITGGASYLSSHDKRVIVGLGDGFVLGAVDAEIRWPSGALQRLPNLKLRQYHKIAEPTGNGATQIELKQGLVSSNSKAAILDSK